ncbi:MAG: MarR family transcriptional regulator [Bacteroidota bacterium]
MNYDTLRQLIDQFEQFEKETTITDLPSFAVWLNDRFDTTQPEVELHSDFERNPRIQLSYCISTLFKHARHYAKTALRDNPLKGLNDFAFAATLEDYGDMRKTELIQHNLSELSPGMEVIRRLLRNGLIEDFDDPEDRRSKRVRLTDEGRKALRESMQNMSQAVNIISGRLSEKELFRLLHLLQKLVDFHHPIWHNYLGKDLELISQEFLNPTTDQSPTS